jgi:hypothetical protein
MPRKKKTVIKGVDAEYTSDFSQPLPTNKPKAQEQPPEVSPPVAAKPEPKPPVKPEPAQPKSEPAKATPQPKPKPLAKSQAVAQGDKREIALSAAVKLDQHDKLMALEAKGTSAKVAITMAGRRAVEQFVPEGKFIEKQDVPRMPMRQGYKSTKRIDAALLDALRDEHDPHRLSSDGAMMRGQFEPLFWSSLDEVIEELNSKD